MLPMDKVELTAYRFLGGIGSCFTMFQSIIWLGLSITGAVCKYLECGASSHKHSFGHCFYLMYIYSESDNGRSSEMGTPSARLNVINPFYFNIMMWVSVGLSLINLIISAIMLSVFLKWVNAIWVKKTAAVWTISIIVFSIIECVMCAAFIYDIIVIAGKDDSKCFMKPELTFFRSAFDEPKPAPYLYELKSNLKNLKKKIRKLKKNLQFLDVVVDENHNPDHIKNPFISKTVLNNHVKEVWHEMFNNNIVDKVQQYKQDFLPIDEVMKKFIEKKQIDLDEVDTSLLKSFDSLTNIKWVKPVEHGNVAIGTKYLHQNIDLGNHTRDINKMAILLHEYLQNINKPPEELIKADKMLDNITRTYLKKVYAQMQDLHKRDLKNKLKFITKEVTENSSLISKTKEGEEILFYVKQFINGLLSLEEVDDDMNERLFQSLVQNITDLFKKNENLEIDNDQKMKNIKEYLRRQYDIDYDDIKIKPEIFFRRANTKKPKSEQQPSPSSASSKLVKELCENCAYFALWPSIVCMLLSLKTGLVWILNIIAVSLVLYYGDKIEIRRRSRLSSIIKYE